MTTELTEAAERSKAYCGRVLLEILEAELIRLFARDDLAFALLAESCNTDDIEKMAIALKLRLEGKS